MIGAIAYNEAGQVGMVTGCEYEEFEDAQIQYQKGTPKVDSSGEPVVKKSMEKRRIAYVGRGLDGQPWRAKQATPLNRIQKQALGA